MSKGSNQRPYDKKKYDNNFEKIFKNNPVKKNMDKFHKPRTHRDKTKYYRKSESEKMQDDLEPITDWENEGGQIHPDSSEELQKLAGQERRVKNWKQEQHEKKVFGNDEMDYSGAFESDVEWK